MKIVQLIPQLSSGGAERFVVDLSNELSLRHEVVLIVSHSLEGKTAFYLPEISERVKVCSLCKKLGFDVRYLCRLFKTLKQMNADVVHTHIGSFTHFALLKWLFPNVKFVHTIHSEAKAESGGRLKALIRKIFFRKKYCTAVTISDASDCSFRNFYGNDVNSELICNGRPLCVEWTDNNLIPRVKGRYNFVSIGHISRVKNHTLLCSAVTQLIEKGAPIELYMFGRSVDEDIINWIKSLNNSHIHLLGEVENPRQYLRNADVFCLSSVREGMPISLIEALSCGLIPICTAVGGVANMLQDGKTGFLSEDLSVETYVEAIERFLSLSANEVEEMKQRCLKLSYQYSIEICAKKYEDLFNRLL